jgi:hypothetical protein
VTGFLEKIPAVTPGLIEVPASTASETNGEAATKGKSKTSSIGLNNDSNKDTKNHEKEEAALQPLAWVIQEPPAFIAKPPVAVGFPAPRLESGNELVSVSGNSKRWRLGSTS